MADVYAARLPGERGFERHVAIKRMRALYAGEDDYVTMFLDEACVAAHIRSPHCVSTLDLGRDDAGTPYLVMDLVLGISFDELIHSGGVPVGVTVELIAQAAEGLHAAHECLDDLGRPLHIVHRDVSPHNILIGMDGSARISDFGVAHAAYKASRTRSGHVKGKLRYLSPEQAAAKQVDRRSDLFSLGLVAWEALTGERFVGDTSDLLAVRRRLLEDRIPSPEELQPAVPPTVAKAVMKALERDPQARPSTAIAFARALRRAARQELDELPTTIEIGELVRARTTRTSERLAWLLDGNESGVSFRVLPSLSEPVDPGDATVETPPPSFDDRFDDSFVAPVVSGPVVTGPDEGSLWRRLWARVRDISR